MICMIETIKMMPSDLPHNPAGPQAVMIPDRKMVGPFADFESAQNWLESAKAFYDTIIIHNLYPPSGVNALG